MRKDRVHDSVVCDRDAPPGKLHCTLREAVSPVGFAHFYLVVHNGA